MSKQYLVVNEDQILVDLQLIFSAIRDADGDWEQVEQDLQSMLESIHGMVEIAESDEEDDDDSDDEDDDDDSEESDEEEKQNSQ